MKKNSALKYLITLGLASLSASVTSPSMASAYQVLNYFYNAEASGDAGSGGAAIAQDASTVFTNPAGMVRIPTYQLVVVGSYLDVKTRFSGTNTWTTTNPALPPFLRTFTESGSANGSVTQFIPAAHFSMPIPCACNWRFGFSVAPIYGLATYYDSDSIVRYNSTKSSLRIVDLSPAIAYAFDNQWSLGVGFDAAQADVNFRAMAGIPSITPLAPTTNDALSKNTSMGWGYGGHVGLLYQMTPCTRFGINYRSRITINTRGTSTLSGAGAIIVGETSLNNFRVRLVLPPVTSLSAYTQVAPCWDVFASAYYNQWKTIPGQVILNNVAAPTATTVTLPWHYRNTWLVALGTSYKISPCWLLRAGVHYDQTPIKNGEIYPVIPDGDRTAVAIGARYQVSKCVALDLGWSHFFVKRATITGPTTVGSQTSTPNGTSRTGVNIVSGQLTWDLA